jgi:hypothetical protein
MFEAIVESQIPAGRQVTRSASIGAESIRNWKME